MYTAVLKRIGISAAYVPFKVKPDQLGPATQSLRNLNINGANVTIPYKSAIIPYMTILSEGAKIIGAVNTIIRNGQELKGYNTNAIGFMDTLEEQGFDTGGKRALVFGSGGGARAVVFILNWLRAANINIAGRTDSRVDNIVQNIGGASISLESMEQAGVDANIIVNTTPVSAVEDSPEFAEFIMRQDFSKCELIVDLNYGRKNNFWHQKALKDDIPFINGLSPLAHSARRTVMLWTRIDVEPGEFLKALKDV